MSISKARLNAVDRRLPSPVTQPARDEPLNIIDFATNPAFLGKYLYPRQATLLKVMALADDLFTDFDHQVIAEWTAGFVLDGDDDERTWSGTEGTPGDLIDRIAAARDGGHRWFRDVLLLIGRRGSKGFLAGILGAWALWSILADDDPHATFGIDPTKRISMLVFAGSKDQAARNVFSDLRKTVQAAGCFDRYRPHGTSDQLVLFTQAQLDAGVDTTRPDGALIELRASETTQLGARGPAAIGLFFDEFAHLTGAGSTADSVELYNSATPAAEQFGPHALTVQTTSPWDRQGQAWITYQRACSVDPRTGTPADPTSLVVQLPSWALYEDHANAPDLEMWPDGPRFSEARSPIMKLDARLEREEAANPDSFAVEYRAQWRSNLAAYLPARFVEDIFGPYNGTRLAMQTSGPLGTRYVAHGDPSLSGANFGFAIAHTELDDHGIPHVVFDVIHHWAPSDFPDGRIDYRTVEDQLFAYIRAFNLAQLTFDTWNSAGSIQRLRHRAQDARLPVQPQIHERTPTAKANWEVAEIFKTAAGHGIIHAPAYPLADAELRGLELLNGKVAAPTAGDVRTKDIADAMMWTTHALIGDGSTELFARLADLPGPLAARSIQQTARAQPRTPNQLMSDLTGSTYNPYFPVAARGDIRGAARSGRHLQNDANRRQAMTYRRPDVPE